MNVCTDGHRVRAVLELGAWEAVRLPWRRSRALPAAALRETLTFDFGSGRSYLRLEGEDGAVYECCDLAGCLAQGDPLLGAIERLPGAREALAAAFTAQWGHPLPYGAEELTAVRCILLCAFIGYDRDFYDTVPLRRGGFAPPLEFRRAARALHRSAALPALVAGCGLPQMKSIRRALFARPALLFYPDALRALIAILPDPNCFCALLGEAQVFSLLSSLQSYPLTAQFYSDLRQCIGSAALLRLLRVYRCSPLRDAFIYAAMDARGRRAQRRAWQVPLAVLTDRCCPYHHAIELGYALPVPAGACPAVPPHSECGPYSVDRLGSVRDFEAAGAALGNCLAEMPLFFSGGTVLAVKRGGDYVAAVQLKAHKVQQALGAHNRPIDPDTPLGAAYSAWSARYGLEQPEPDPDEDALEDMDDVIRIG